ncbi:DUF2971 domain-containing protein [Pontibacter silvestris]|uniref:DUF2971 domain-containing protein n=1 Tax=Pontibacter silvestris TaxID=2305183 RepID=A0ABW4WUJ9_9BACT|nr:DUF2971 domain-containing protein [Pontibacter silvestris]MCC9136242.1 DUF2971 domain-containing protein [Pontibacter silvestris]
MNEELWFSHPNYFNDPFDTNLDIRKVVKKIEDRLNFAPLLYQEIEKFLPTYENDLKNRFVFSTNRGAPDFEPFKEVLMWSHYAKDHTGICVGLLMSSVKVRIMERSMKSRKKTGYGIFDGQSYLDHLTDLPVVYDTNFLESNTIP